MEVVIANVTTSPSSEMITGPGVKLSIHVVFVA